MNVEQALDTALKADATLTGLVGSRIYWMQAAQTATLPYVVYTNIEDSDNQLAFDLTNTGTARMSFSVVGSKPSDKAVMYRIRDLLRGKSGISTLSCISFPAGYRETFNADTMRYVWTIDYDVEFSY